MGVTPGPKFAVTANEQGIANKVQNHLYTHSRRDQYRVMAGRYIPSIPKTIFSNPPNIGVRKR